jgi:hypothetical protein
MMRSTTRRLYGSIGAAALMIGSRVSYPEIIQTVYEVECRYQLDVRGIHGLIEDVVLQGSATAMSADGDLLTARHVIDILMFHAELCAGVYLEKTIPVPIMVANIEIREFELRVRNSIDQEWVGTARVASTGFPCDGSGRLRLVWDPSSTVTIEAIDRMHDLALLTIAAQGIAHVIPERTELPQGTSVITAGFRTSRVMMRRCQIIAPCEMHGEVPLLHVSPGLKQGMSGGPTALDMRLLGINTSIGLLPPHDAFMVPASYAAAWYDWVRGNAFSPPAAVCP